jgi:hypothetical protein
LKFITIPDGVRTVEACTFENCTSLEEIKISKTVDYINVDAFDGCVNLSKILVDDENSTYYDRLGVLMHRQTRSLMRCPQNSQLCNVQVAGKISKIYSGAFKDCRNLERITLKENVTNMGVWAFDGCVNLREVSLSSSLKTIKRGTFRFCKSLEHINIPEATVSIGDKAFFGCVSLQMVKIPPNVHTIHKYAFADCIGLKLAELSEGLKTIEKNAFEYSDIIDLVIPRSVDTIGDKAFDFCKMLHIRVPKTVKHIGNDAFFKCWKVTYID